MLFNINLATITIIFCIIRVKTAKKCVTPNGETADCVSIYNCPVLFQALQTQDKNVIEFGKKSQCGYEKGPLVCCGSSANFTTVPAVPSEITTDLLPTRRYCGYQHADDYVHNHQNTTGTSLIDEFPWLAVLRYSTSSGEKIMCSGSLINDRYVLTAAHCLAERPNVVLIGVRLGEYNIEQTVDCVKDGDLDECSDPIADFGVENVIIHPDYSSYHHLNDIALLRLNRSVQYSDYIRPICLPLPGTPQARVGDTLIGSGWGRVLTTGEESSKIKKKIYTQLFDNQVCVDRYKNRSNVRITEKHICTKETIANLKPVCQGDSGGPVMCSYKNQWIQQGIISFGSGCGTGNPDVNTKVASYVEWITRTIKA